MVVDRWTDAHLLVIIGHRCALLEVGRMLTECLLRTGRDTLVRDREVE